jgi:excisionase family DNA binding protein
MTTSKKSEDSPFIDDPLLTVTQVAGIFQVTKGTVRLWLNDKKLKGTKLNTHWRIRKSEVARFANDLYGDKK